MSIKYAEYKREKKRLYEVDPKELIMLLKTAVYALDTFVDILKLGKFL